MSFSFLCRRLNWLILVIVLGLAFVAIPASAQFYDLEVRVGDTTGSPGEHNSVISVYMKNWTETVGGFAIWLVLDRPDIMEFQTEWATFYDTLYWRCHHYSGPTCTDSSDITDSVLINPSYPWDIRSVHIYDQLVGSDDTTGTLCSGWEMVRSRATNDLGHDLKIAGQANQVRPPYTPGISPQYGEIPLIKIMGDIYNIPPTMTDRTVHIYIQADNLDNFSFSTEDGRSIGVITDTVIDTSWFQCQTWNETHDTCYFWKEVGTGPADSFHCCDTILTGHLDTSKVKIKSGKLVVSGGLCGDVDDNKSINILDVGYLIRYLYKGGPPPLFPTMADVNSSGSTNILDVAYIVAFLYKGGPAPNCP